MVLSAEEIDNYCYKHPITEPDLVWMYGHLPNRVILEICLQLIDYGYDPQDIIIMADSSRTRREKQMRRSQ